MAKQPKIDDYGGNAYVRGSRNRTTRKGNTSSFRCDSCHKINYLTKRELSRASRPRCTACGGMLVETASEEKRHKPMRAQVIGKTYRCKFCGRALGDFKAFSLVTHLLVKRSCLKEAVQDLVVRFYWEDHSGVLNLDRRNLTLIFGTLEIYKVKDGGHPWALRGPTPDGEEVTVAHFQHRYEADDAITKMNDSRGMLKTEEVYTALELLKLKGKHDEANGSGDSEAGDDGGDSDRPLRPAEPES
jgi:hypothetical protein